MTRFGAAMTEAAETEAMEAGAMRTEVVKTGAMKAGASKFGAFRLVALPHGAPLLARFMGKLVHDVLPAALASLIGGFLFTQYQSGHTVATVQAVPASTEMLQLVRDEHSMILNFLKSQMAAEQSRQAAENEADARAVADAKSVAEAKSLADAKIVAEAKAMAEAKVAAEARAAATAQTQRVAAALAAAKPVTHRKSPPVTTVAATAQPPLVIAQAEQVDAVAPVQPSGRDPDSLLSKTLDLKDHVVAGTRQVVTAIVGIPNWIVDRLGGNTQEPAPRQFSAAS